MSSSTIAFPTLLPARIRAAAALVLALGAAAGATARDASADDLLIVDCLLPPRTHRLGTGNRYLAPRQPIRTTAADCRLRGGEHAEGEAADYRATAKLWLAGAEAGEPIAQYRLGQIHERGLDGTVDYGAAERWYRAAAEQGYAPAQIGLGHLYEEGLGVDADGREALEWYRRAAGLDEALVVLPAAEHDALLELRDELAAERREIERLESEVQELRRRLRDAEADASARGRIEQRLLDLEREVTARRAELATRLEGPDGYAAPAPLDFGHYHALLIANRDYAHLPDYPAPAGETERLASVLRDRYAFSVRVLHDADRKRTMQALNELRSSMGDGDRVLLHYSGHSRREAATQSAYWLPVDAEPDNPANWVPTAVVSDHLDLVPARHVLVVADAAYAGLRSRSSVVRLPSGTEERGRRDSIRALLDRRVRLVLAAGLEAGGSAPPTSGFTAALIEVLGANRRVLEVAELYRRLVLRLDGPVPELATMRWATSELGSFFFVPVTGTSAVRR